MCYTTLFIYHFICVMYVHTNSSTVHFTCKYKMKCVRTHCVPACINNITENTRIESTSTPPLHDQYCKCVCIVNRKSMVWVIAHLNGKIGVVRSQHSLVLSLDGCALLFIAIIWHTECHTKAMFSFFFLYIWIQTEAYPRYSLSLPLYQSISRYKFVHTNTRTHTHFRF